MTCYVPGTEEKDSKKLILSLQQLAAGRSNATGTVTLTQNAATTTVTDANCSEESVPILVPTTANAAAEVGGGTMYISARASGSFTITHANSATASRTFYYALHG
jgi:hypothetical protein